MLEEGHPPGFSDPRAMREVLGFEAEEVGGCAVARHPRWGPNVYPVSVVAAVSRAPVHAQGEEQQQPSFDWKVWMQGVLHRCAAPLAADVPVVWV